MKTCGGECLERKRHAQHTFSWSNLKVELYISVLCVQANAKELKNWRKPHNWFCFSGWFFEQRLFYFFL